MSEQGSGQASQQASQQADVVMAGLAKSFGKARASFGKTRASFGKTAGGGVRRVLDELDLTVPAGTMTAVLGPSGCGKTTLLRIVAGFEHPDSGRVDIGGRTVAGNGSAVPAHRRRVGLMPQEGALFPHRSVAGNVAFGLPPAQRGAAEVERWLAVVGLADLAAARPHQLSGGQQQRVALARALAARPQVLLLDEPFAALDAGLRVRVREDITAILRESHTTAMLVTHDQSEALSLADSVAVLLGGKIVQNAAPGVLYHEPATLEVARFVGDTVELDGECRSGVAHTALGAHPVRGAAIDGPVVVVLRPGQLRVGGTEDPRGVVTARRYYGEQAATHVCLDSGGRVVLHGPADGAGAELRPGDVVTVAVDGSVLAFPGPGPSPTGGKRMALREAGG